MSEAEKKEYDLFTDYKPEHFELSWENYKITGFRTVAEYSAYCAAREHEQNVCFEFLKNWKIGETNSAFGAEIQNKLEEYKHSLTTENERLKETLTDDKISTASFNYFTGDNMEREGFEQGAKWARSLLFQSTDKPSDSAASTGLVEIPNRTPTP